MELKIENNNEKPEQEFKLEGFDDEKEVFFSLEDFDTEPIKKTETDRIDKKQTTKSPFNDSYQKKSNPIKIYKNYLYGKFLKRLILILIQISILLIIGFFFVPLIVDKSINIFTDITNFNSKQIGIQKHNQDTKNNHQSVSGNKKEITLAKPQKYHGAVYSWTNERGQRVFSNVGLPKDKQYTDPKIEWQ